MTIHTRTRLADFFLTIAEYEQDIEAKRIALSSHPEFEPYQLFTRFDRDQKGHVVAYDINMFLQTVKREQRNDRYYSIEECSLMVMFFDATFQDRLTYHDFMTIMLPCTDSALRTRVCQQ